MKSWSIFHSMTSVLCIIILVVAVLPPDCLAAAADTAGSGGGYLSGYENTDPKPSQMSWWSTLAYLVSLVAVFAFVVVMAYFASRFLSGRFQSSEASYDGGRLLEHLPLGPNKSVCVVEIADKVVVLGVTEHQISLLAEVEDSEEIDRLRRQAIARPADSSAFASQLSSLEELSRRIPSLLRDRLNRRG